ncbi:hypothetical protein Hanom_Chr02g00129761 [Helianthus anomalus]
MVKQAYMVSQKEKKQGNGVEPVLQPYAVNAQNQLSQINILIYFGFDKFLYTYISSIFF